MNNIVSGTLLALMAFTLVAHASNGTGKPPVQVASSNNLAQLGHQSLQERLPVLLVFSADHCPYCELLETEILKPMLLSGQYEQKVIIRKIDTDAASEVHDFDGQKISVQDLMSRYKVFVTPTMLFLGPDGKELSERLVGINTVEMFGGLVDDAIEVSLHKLRGGTPGKLASRQ